MNNLSVSVESCSYCFLIHAVNFYLTRYHYYLSNANMPVVAAYKQASFSLTLISLYSTNILLYWGCSSVVERSLCMREARGSKPRTSILLQRIPQVFDNSHSRAFRSAQVESKLLSVQFTRRPWKRDNLIGGPANDVKSDVKIVIAMATWPL